MFSAAGQEVAWRAARLITPAQQVYRVMEASTTLRPMERAAAREATGVKGAPAILWVGRLNENKDPLTMLDGLEMSLARLPEATVTMIYSAGNLLPAVEDRLRESPALRRCVRLVVYVPHRLMPAFYSAADLFVLGSHHEGSGYALLEALACGVAPVVTDIPTFRLMTADGSIGALWTSDPGRPRALVDRWPRTRYARGQIRALRPRLELDGCRRKGDARVSGRGDDAAIGRGDRNTSDPRREP